MEYLNNNSNGNGGLLKSKSKKKSLLGYLFGISFELTIGKKTYKWSWNSSEEYFKDAGDNDSVLKVIVFN